MSPDFSINSQCAKGADVPGPTQREVFVKCSRPTLFPSRLEIPLVTFAFYLGTKQFDCKSDRSCTSEHDRMDSYRFYFFVLFFFLLFVVYIMLENITKFFIFMCLSSLEFPSC